MSQVIQLGLTGAETTLATESRSFDAFDNALISTEGRSADGTLHTDFIANKEGFVITYAVVTEANKDVITNIYKLQITNAVFLSFKQTDPEIPGKVLKNAGLLWSTPTACSISNP